MKKALYLASALVICLSLLPFGNVVSASAGFCGFVVTWEQSVIMGMRLFEKLKEEQGNDTQNVLPLPEPDSEPEPPPQSAFDFEETPVAASQLIEYYDLSSEEREFYDRVSLGIENFEFKIEVPEINDLEIRQKIIAVLGAARPEFFWWNGSIKYQKNEEGQYCVWPVYSIDGDELSARLFTNGRIEYPPETETEKGKEWIKTAKAALRVKLGELPLRAQMTPYELELAVHDWLCLNVEYVISTSGGPNSRTIYGAIVEGETNCTGFAKSFSYIMNLMGIECLSLYGTVNDPEIEKDHMWNAVKLDGQWYQADLTRDGILSKKSGLPVRYALNRAEAFFAEHFQTLGIDGYPGINPDIAYVSDTYK
jgi:hypothetical protein